MNNELCAGSLFAKFPELTIAHAKTMGPFYCHGGKFIVWNPIPTLFIVESCIYNMHYVYNKLSNFSVIKPDEVKNPTQARSQIITVSLSSSIFLL